MGAERILFHPLERGAIPAPHGPVLVLGAGRGFQLPAALDPSQVTLVQPFRPDFLALSGQTVMPAAPEGRFASVFVLGGRARARNEALVETALSRLAPGGMLVVAATLADGGDSLARRLVARLPGAERLSKHHGVVVYATVADPATLANPPTTGPGTGWEIPPGTFSGDGPDPGSRLLLDHLPGDLAGSVADFGAGWGYLAIGLAGRCPSVCHVDLLEADRDALDAARRNWTARTLGPEAGFHWIDLTSEAAPRRYDAVVMNPPFHVGRASEPELGQAFIAAAARALKPGGRLFLVANRGLPYEAILSRLFADSGELARDATFKVLWAARPVRPSAASAPSRRG